MREQGGRQGGRRTDLVQRRPPRQDGQGRQAGQVPAGPRNRPGPAREEKGQGRKGPRLRIPRGYEGREAGRRRSQRRQEPGHGGPAGRRGDRRRQGEVRAYARRRSGKREADGRVVEDLRDSREGDRSGREGADEPREKGGRGRPPGDRPAHERLLQRALRDDDQPPPRELRLEGGDDRSVDLQHDGREGGAAFRPGENGPGEEREVRDQRDPARRQVRGDVPLFRLQIGR